MAHYVLYYGKFEEALGEYRKARLNKRLFCKGRTHAE